MLGEIQFCVGVKVPTYRLYRKGRTDTSVILVLLLKTIYNILKGFRGAVKFTPHGINRVKNAFTTTLYLNHPRKASGLVSIDPHDRVTCY